MAAAGFFFAERAIFVMLAGIHRCCGRYTYIEIYMQGFPTLKLFHGLGLPTK